MVIMDFEVLKTKIEEAIKNKERRNFKQSVELIVVLKNVEIKELKNKIQNVMLSHYNNSRVVLFSEIRRDDIKDVKNITLKDIENISKSKRESKKFARSFDFALAETKLLTTIGKVLGRFLAPLGKMPMPITDEKRLNDTIEKLRKSIRVNLKQNQIQLKIGKEDMKIDEIFENAKEALNQIMSVLPEGDRNIKKIYVKLTMSKPIRVL